MGVRARKKLRLNFAALRKRSPNPGAQNGIARRTVLLGAATAAVSTTSIGRAVASATLRIKERYDKAGELQSITVGAKGMRAWTLDVSLYDGDPALSLSESASELVIRLDGARLPGTEFKINLTATLKQKLLSRTIEFQFSETGVEPCDFSMSAPFDEWLAEGNAFAELTASEASRLLGTDRSLHRHFQAKPEGRAWVAFLPDGGFSIQPSSLGLRAGEWTLSVAGLHLAPRKNASNGAIDDADSKCTFLQAQRGGAWRGKVVWETPEGWSAKGTVKGFDKLTAEIHSPETLYVCLEGDGKFDLDASNGNGIAFKLDRARIAHLITLEQTTRALTAKIHQAGSWLSYCGFSLEIGPNGEDAEALFAEFENENGKESYADIQGGIRNATFQLDGAVTKARMTGVEPISLVTWEDAQGGVRPGTTLQPTGGQIRPGVASRLDIQAVPKFRLAPFQIEVVRREDMLALTFEFVNLSLSGGATPSLVRSDATKPAYIAVIFPPQSLAEAHYQEGPTGAPTLSALSGLSRRPIPSRLSGESRLVFWVPTAIASIPFSLKGDNGQGRNGLLDWAKWKPSITATAVSAYGSQRIRVDSGFINPIDSVTIKPRLGSAIRVTPPPEEESDPGFFDSLRKLAARRGPSVQGGVRPGQIRPSIVQPNTGLNQVPKQSAASQLGRLAAGIDPTVVFKFIPKARIEPNALHTQIEMPVRLILSPTEDAGWSHPAVLDDTPPGNRHALWHSRLGNLVAGVPEPTIHLFSDDGKSYYKRTSAGSEGPFEVGTRSGPTVRAIDAVDYGVSNLMPVIPSQTQGQVVQEYPMTQGRRKELVDSMCWRGEGAAADTPPFMVENLMLTPLGGYLKGEWVWRQPAGWPNPTKPELITWRHVSTLGRDHYMKLVIRGYVFPTGHKATLTIISERKFNTTTEGKVVAYVRTRRFVTIRDPLIAVSGTDQQALGFQAITMLTHETPILDPFAGPYSQWGGVGLQSQDQIMLLYSGGQPVMFQMKGVDMEGRTIPWAQPMLFVAISINSTQGSRIEKLITEYEKNEKGGFPGGFPRRGKLYGQTVAFAKGGGQAPTGEDAEGNTSFPVNTMLISGKTYVGAAQQLNLDQARWKPVLHRAAISAPAVQMMQGKPPTLGALHLPGESFDLEQLQASTEADMMFEEDDFFDVKIPEVFKNSGFGSGNKSQMFLELIDKYAPKFGDTSKSGGIVNPEMLIQGLSKGKGPIGGELNEILNGNVDPKKLLDQGARLLGAVKIFDLLPNPIKIDPGGTDAPYIELLLIYDDGKNKPPTGATTAVKWKPPLQNWGFPSSPPLFYVKSFKNPQPKFGGATGELLLEGSITTKFKGGGKPKMVFRGSMKNFRVDLISPASFLWLDFKIIEFIAEVGKPFDVNVDMTKMTFTGPLTFVQKLQDLINGDSGDGLKVDLDSDGEPKSSLLNTADVGIDVYLDVDETGIRAGLTLGIPSVGVGVFAIRNISIGVKLILPFFGDPLSARFNFCERNNTFQISVMGVTGGGFVAMEVNIDGNMIFEAALEFGGSLSIDLGVASGGVSIMGGCYFRLENKECMLEAYIRLQGNLSVLGLIRISLEFYLSLTYYSDGNRLVGTATITVEIEILFFSISVGVTVQRQLAGESSGGSYFFAGPNALPQEDKTTKFTEAVSQTQWVQFCEAFA